MNISFEPNKNITETSSYFIKTLTSKKSFTLSFYESQKAMHHGETFYSNICFINNDNS